MARLTHTTPKYLPVMSKACVLFTRPCATHQEYRNVAPVTLSLASTSATLQHRASRRAPVPITIAPVEQDSRRRPQPTRASSSAYPCLARNIASLFQRTRRATNCAATLTALALCYAPKSTCRTRARSKAALGKSLYCH
jgi:hypothetical protein